MPSTIGLFDAMIAYDFGKLPSDMDIFDVEAFNLPASDMEQFKGVVYKKSRVEKENFIVIEAVDGIITFDSGRTGRKFVVRGDGHLAIYDDKGFVSLPLVYTVMLGYGERQEDSERLRDILRKGYAVKETDGRSVTVQLPLSLDDIDVIGLYKGVLCMFGSRSGNCFVIEGYNSRPATHITDGYYTSTLD